mmetsp:Transcript_27456/g.76949  ORF Transcript_27456/g.76949 Transcript_27456/m.76949 type:complete len:229 (-) Transcript_27456:100-786(-)
MRRPRRPRALSRAFPLASGPRRCRPSRRLRRRPPSRPTAHRAMQLSEARARRERQRRLPPEQTAHREPPSHRPPLRTRNPIVASRRHLPPNRCRPSRKKTPSPPHRLRRRRQRPLSGACSAPIPRPSRKETRRAARKMRQRRPRHLQWLQPFQLQPLARPCRPARKTRGHCSIGSLRNTCPKCPRVRCSSGRTRRSCCSGVIGAQAIRWRWLHKPSSSRSCFAVGLLS